MFGPCVLMQHLACLVSFLVVHLSLQGRESNGWPSQKQSSGTDLAMKLKVLGQGGLMPGLLPCNQRENHSYKPYISGMQSVSYYQWYIPLSKIKQSQIC